MYDLVGIGFGPSNLALAIALEEELGRGELPSRAVFLEKQSSSTWHPGMMLPGATLQVSFLKDLVTMRNPTSRYTFVNYLKTRGRLEEFVNLRTFFPARQEFGDYLQWVASHYEDLACYNSCVKSITPVRSKSDGMVTSLLVEVESGDAYETRDLVVGTGGEPSVPPVFKPMLGPRIFHSSNYIPVMVPPEDLDDAVVAVVGSGQSAAEIIYHIASRAPNVQVISMIRDFSLRPMDDSKFVNEVFFPHNVDYTYSLSPEKRTEFLRAMRTANYSAVDMDLIDDLYRLIYESKVAGKEPISFLNYTDVEDASFVDGRINLDWRNCMTHQQGSVAADYVILGTGFSHRQLPAFLDPLHEFVLHEEGAPLVERNYMLRCRDDFMPRVYLQGFAEHSHGITDTLLSISAHRAATIARSVGERLQDRQEHRELMPSENLSSQWVVPVEQAASS